MRISDWSSDVCSSDLHRGRAVDPLGPREVDHRRAERLEEVVRGQADAPLRQRQAEDGLHGPAEPGAGIDLGRPGAFVEAAENEQVGVLQARLQGTRSEAHTSELQSRMLTSYAVFC